MYFPTNDLKLATVKNMTVHEATNVHTCPIKGLVFTALSN